MSSLVDLMAVQPSEQEGWQLCKLNNVGVATDDELRLHIEATLKRGYTRFNEYFESQKGTASICGFGPSLVQTWPLLKGDVMAVNRSHDWLIERGVVPRWCLLMDPVEVVSEMVSPHPEVVYMVASRCHPKVFEKLDGFNVVVWHAAGDSMIEEIVANHFQAPTEEEALAKIEPTINGGSSGVTRGAVMLVAMGYTDIHIHGADSSFPKDGDTHVLPSLVPESQIKVKVEGREFYTAPWMTLHLEDLEICLEDLQRRGNKFTFYGDGLLQWVARHRGFTVVN